MLILSKEAEYAYERGYRRGLEDAVRIADSHTEVYREREVNGQPVRIVRHSSWRGAAFQIAREIRALLQIPAREEKP